MQSFKQIENIYFLGIGGIGMSALARYFKNMGKQVSGYDKTSTILTDELISEGISVHFEDNIQLINPSILNLQSAISNTLIVYTPAVPKNHSEYVFFVEKGFNIKKRSEVLGMITEHSRTIAVAGTHGKTTTSSLIAHILKFAGEDIGAFLGGITKNYGTNLLLPSSIDTKHTVVVEADEYDRSFLTLHPSIAVITSLDPDHLDIYGDKKYMEESYRMFSNQVKDKLIVKKSIVSTLNSKHSPITYSLNESGDYHALNVTVNNGEYHYDVVTPRGVIKDVVIGLPGSHNVENSIAAFAVADQLNIPSEKIKNALASFSGVKRRFDYQIKTNNLVFIDDYAHHPEELKACIRSVKELYPDKKITGIFQPHLYTRTRDFADGFAESLDMLDRAILLDIYPARELPIPGVTSEMLLKKMKGLDKVICSKENLLKEINKNTPQVLLTLGAGDIDMFVDPIKKELLK